MRGFITDKDLYEAEAEFPGICRFFASLHTKPRTFLELVARFDHWITSIPETSDLAAA